MRMLLVDNNESFISTTQNLFSKMGIEVLTARNENEILSIVGESDIDVIFMSMEIESIDNKSILKKIRKSNPIVDIIVLIESENLSSAAEAMEFGATDYLMKPVRMKFLLEKAEESCKRMQKYRYLVESTKPDSPSSTNLNS